METRRVHGPDFQRAVLRLMMKEIPFCAKAVSYLDESFFGGELKWFFRKIKNHFDNHHNVMSDFFLTDAMFLFEEKDRPPYEAERLLILEQDKVIGAQFGGGITEFEKQQRDIIKRDVTGFIRNNLFIGAYSQASSIYNMGNREEAFSFTKKKVDELIQVDFERSKVVDFTDLDEVCDIAASQTKNAIPTGIYHIDQALGGGLMPQTWTTFLGASNAGKSILCTNLAYFAVHSGKKVFVTIHEDEKIPTEIRYLSRFSGVPFNKLTQPRQYWTNEEKMSVDMAKELLKASVRLRFMYSGECFIENVIEAARIQKLESDYDLFLCDYGQCLKSKEFKGVDNRYSMQGFIYQELKQICLELNIAGAGGAQVNRSGYKVSKDGDDLLRCSDIGDSFDIIKKSSNVITMNRSDDDVDSDRIIFLLDKVRSGKCPVATQCVTDYKRMVTHLPYEQNKRTQLEIPVASLKGNKHD